jgi:hypothetical protein
MDNWKEKLTVILLIGGFIFNVISIVILLQRGK